MAKLYDADKDIVQYYKYRIKKVSVIRSNNTEIEINFSKILELSIEENYEDYYFPLISIRLSIPGDLYYTIINEKDTCSLFLRITKLYYKDAERTDDSLEKEYINEKFQIIMDQNTKDLLSSVSDDAKSSDYTESTETQVSIDSASDNDVTFFLFKKDIVKASREIINEVLVKATVTDAIAYLATKMKLPPGRIIMKAADNNKKYKELLIPPQSILKNFSFIDTYYGIYKKGSIIYFGINYSYIIPFTGKCDVKLKDDKAETTNIIIPKATNSDVGEIEGTLKKYKQDDYYIIADYSSLDEVEKSNINSILAGAQAVIIDSFDYIIEKEDEDATEANIINYTENKFYKQTVQTQLNADDNTFEVQISNYDIAAFQPNKKFNIIFEDNKYKKAYNAQYSLARIKHIFTTTTQEMEVTGLLLLRKMTKNKDKSENKKYVNTDTE